MRFTIDQRYDAAPEAVARAYADPELYAHQEDGPKLARPEVVAHEVDGDTVRLQVRYRFRGELSAAARAILDPARLSWVEHSVHDLAACTSTFVLRPDSYADRFRCEGSLRIVAADGGSRRQGTGELRVRAPLVAGSVERTLVADLQDHLSAEVAYVNAFVDDGRS
jgi:uncharacterized protein DUF2505